MSDDNTRARDKPEDLATSEYWDKRYLTSASEAPTHEWFRSFSALEPFLQKHLFDLYPASLGPRVLHLGSGDSTIPTDLVKRGYTNQLCVDFSPIVVELMSKRSHSGVEWQRADVRDMKTIPNQCIDVAFDKGTMDAMIYGDPWDPPDAVRSDTAEYMREVARVLKPDGLFLYITYRQPHFIRPLLNSNDLWEMDMTILSDATGSSFEYYGWLLRRKLP